MEEVLISKNIKHLNYGYAVCDTFQYFNMDPQFEIYNTQ